MVGSHSPGLKAQLLEVDGFGFKPLLPDHRAICESRLPRLSNGHHTAGRLDT